jgi:hypothetical protein
MEVSVNRKDQPFSSIDVENPQAPIKSDRKQVLAMVMRGVSIQLSSEGKEQRTVFVKCQSLEVFAISVSSSSAQYG